MEGKDDQDVVNFKQFNTISLALKHLSDLWHSYNYYFELFRSTYFDLLNPNQFDMSNSEGAVIEKNQFETDIER